MDDGGNVLETFDYYPFGLLMPQRNTAGANTIEKFTGKERDTEGNLNLDYFGARYYDAAIARWNGVDPMVDKYPSLSPYNYVVNNPLNVIDPDGKRIRAVDEETQKYILGFINDLFGEGHGFSFNKKGYLKFSKKEFDKENDFTSEQLSLIDGFKEVANNKDVTIHAKVSEDENLNLNINFEDNGITFNWKQDKSTKGSNGNYLGGEIGAIGFSNSNAILMINLERASDPLDAGNGEKTKPCASCTFTHELLDHGLYFIRNGVLDPPKGTSPVLYHNKALKVKGSKPRTGKDHGVKN